MPTTHSSPQAQTTGRDCDTPPMEGQCNKREGDDSLAPSAEPKKRRGDCDTPPIDGRDAGAAPPRQREAAPGPLLPLVENPVRPNAPIISTPEASKRKENAAKTVEFINGEFAFLKGEFEGIKDNYDNIKKSRDKARKILANPLKPNGEAYSAKTLEDARKFRDLGPKKLDQLVMSQQFIPSLGTDAAALHSSLKTAKARVAGTFFSTNEEKRWAPSPLSQTPWGQRSSDEREQGTQER